MLRNDVMMLAPAKIYVDAAFSHTRMPSSRQISLAVALLAIGSACAQSRRGGPTSNIVNSWTGPDASGKFIAGGGTLDGCTGYFLPEWC